MLSTGDTVLSLLPFQGMQNSVARPCEPTASTVLPHAPGECYFQGITRSFSWLCPLDECVYEMARDWTTSDGLLLAQQNSRISTTKLGKLEGAGIRGGCQRIGRIFSSRLAIRLLCQYHRVQGSMSRTKLSTLQKSLYD